MEINGIGSVNRIQTVKAAQTANVKASDPQVSFDELLSKRDKFKNSPVGDSSSISSSIPVTKMKLEEISAGIRNADYSEMTSAEIYADIEGRYADAFEDFYATFAVATCTDHCMLHMQFLDDVRNNVGKTTSDLLNEARGYSGMDYDEIEAAIKEKYIGKTGFIDQLNLFGELFSSGVLYNKYGSDNAVTMALRLSLSVECGGDAMISRNEWLSRIEETGASSPFTLLLNCPFISGAEKELFQTMVDDILFGIMDKEG